MSSPTHVSVLKLLRTKKVNRERSQATTATFSADGTLLAIACSASGFDNAFRNKVRVWDVVNWRQVSEFPGCSDVVDGVAFSPDGKVLACAGSTTERFMGGEIKLWNSRTWKPIRTIEEEGLWSLRRVIFSPDGLWIATGSAVSGRGQKLQLWNSKTGKQVREFGLMADDISGLTFSRDSKSLAVGVPGDRSVSVYSIPSGRKRWQVKAHAQASHLSVVCSPNGKLLASCGDKNVALWDVKSGKSTVVLKGHADDVRSLAFSLDGTHLLSASWRELRVWDVAKAATVGSESLDHLNLITIRLDDAQQKLTAIHTINDEISILQYAFHSAALQPETSPLKASTRQPSREEQKWIRTVFADPENDAPRLQYAKWLDEQGDPRGKFIRVLCELAQSQTRSNTGLRNRERKLLKDHFKTWTAPLASLEVGPQQCEFRRGFLWKLQLNDISVTDKSLKLLHAFPELEHLDLRGSKVTNKGMPVIAAIKNLRSLELDETAVTPQALKELSGLKRLILCHNGEWGNQPIAEVEKLKLARNRRFLRLPVVQQRAEAIQALTILLDYLPPSQQGIYPGISYSQSWASNADLVYLQAIPEVEELDFFECRAVTQVGLKQLVRLPNLKKLWLTESGVTDLAPLQNLPHLEELNLDSLTSLDPRSFRHLPKLKNLRVLTVRFCDLGDEILPYIAKCVALRELDVIYNKFTKEGLQLLDGLALQKFEHD